MRVVLGSARRLLFAFLKHSKPSLSLQAALLSHRYGGSMVRTLFAFPYDLRMLALSNIDQARIAYTQVMDAATQAMNIWLDALPRSEVTSHFKAVHQQAMGYAKQNVEAALTVAAELAKAENLQDVLAKQNRYAQTQMHNYDLQAQELGRLMVGSA